jgi:hypothetical protein
MHARVHRESHAGADHDEENGQPCGSCHQFLLPGSIPHSLAPFLNQFRRLKVASRIGPRFRTVCVVGAGSRQPPA